MNKALITLSFLLTLLILPIKTFAWGSKGHAMVAEVAFNYMDENTKKEVLKYLDGMTIQEAANWMDNVKSDHSYDYMRAYHYANFDKGANVVETNGDNIVFQLNTTIKELQNKESLSKEQINTKIKILFHLMGDLHQPLHVGYGEDKGGNTIQLNYNFRGTNLHSLWDSGIIEYKKITLQDCLKANNYSKNEIRAIQYTNVVNWATDTRAYLPQIYKTGGNKINDDYVDACAPLIENQILKAGIRLAGVLNEVFKN
ncbi:S1/P1 nuclease [Flavobacterium limnophilum]|uniref:S1/P1 nuclease n=1 Tax=Flavobacterium limnophilum TaxID=3003262 RepID=UPI002482F230|nr:S1/P1 nuclease [Flavobacterium limnophilum]